MILRDGKRIREAAAGGRVVEAQQGCGQRPLAASWRYPAGRRRARTGRAEFPAADQVIETCQESHQICIQIYATDLNK